MILELFGDIPLYLLGFCLALCVAGGWLLDNAMRDNGAGTIGNTLLLSVGAVAGLMLAVYMGTNLFQDYLRAIALATGCAIWTLLLWCFVKSRISV